MGGARVSVDGLRGVAETLLIPLYYRALEHQRPDAIVRDPAAAEAVRQIDYDFSRFGKAAFDQLTTAMRVRVFDRHTRDFIARHRQSAVVEIGCGLSGRFPRVDDGSVEWFDLDLPPVMAVRAKLLAPAERVHPVSASAANPDWLPQVQTGRPTLFLAEGVLPYLSPRDVRRLILAMADQFTGAEMVFDAFSPAMLWIGNMHSQIRSMGVRMQWSVRDDRELERWGPGINLLDRWDYFEQPEPRLGSARLLRFVPILNRGTRILHYRLGGSTPPAAHFPAG